jgi:hypothetical protein
LTISTFERNQFKDKNDILDDHFSTAQSFSAFMTLRHVETEKPQTWSRHAENLTPFYSFTAVKMIEKPQKVYRKLHKSVKRAAFHIQDLKFV